MSKPASKRSRTMVLTAASSTYPVGLRERLGIRASSSKRAFFALSALDGEGCFFAGWPGAGLACGSAGLSWAGIHAGRANAAIIMIRFMCLSSISECCGRFVSDQPVSSATAVLRRPTGYVPIRALSKTPLLGSAGKGLQFDGIAKFAHLSRECRYAALHGLGIQPPRTSFDIADLVMQHFPDHLRDPMSNCPDRFVHS